MDNSSLKIEIADMANLALCVERLSVSATEISLFLSSSQDVARLSRSADEELAEITTNQNEDGKYIVDSGYKSMVKKYSEIELPDRNNEKKCRRNLLKTDFGMDLHDQFLRNYQKKIDDCDSKKISPYLHLPIQQDEWLAGLSQNKEDSAWSAGSGFGGDFFSSGNTTGNDSLMDDVKDSSLNCYDDFKIDLENRKMRHSSESEITSEQMEDQKDALAEIWEASLGNHEIDLNKAFLISEVEEQDNDKEKYGLKKSVNIEKNNKEIMLEIEEHTENLTESTINIAHNSVLDLHSSETKMTTVSLKRKLVENCDALISKKRKTLISNDNPKCHNVGKLNRVENLPSTSVTFAIGKGEKVKKADNGKFDTHHNGAGDRSPLKEMSAIYPE